MKNTFVKNFAIVFGMLFAGTLMAITERPPAIVIHDGNARGFIGARAWVTKRQNAPELPGGIRFNGKDSLLILNAPHFYPDQICSVTFAADVTIDRIGTPAIIAGRVGYHNAIGINQEGRAFFNCFGPGQGRQVKAAQVTGKTKLVPGRRYRIAGVLDCLRGDNNTHLLLYVNGTCEGAAVLPGPPRLYSRSIFVGGMPGKGTPQHPFAGTLHEFYLFYKPLTRTEICRLPGKNDFKSWSAFQPMIDLQKAKPAETLTGEGVTVRNYRLPAAAGSVTMTAKFRLNRLPAQTGVICGRPGFDNVLFVEADGRLGVSCWNEFRTECLKLQSTSRIKAGDTVRVTVVVESCGVETRMSLFVNGRREAFDVMTGSAYLCRPEFCVKGMKKAPGIARNPLDCEILDCRIYGIALTDEELRRMEW